jgi:hypothetical protein
VVEVGVLVDGAGLVVEVAAFPDPPPQLAAKKSAVTAVRLAQRYRFTWFPVEGGLTSRFSAEPEAAPGHHDRVTALPPSSFRSESQHEPPNQLFGRGFGPTVPSFDEGPNSFDHGPSRRTSSE